jgi:molybdate transport system ATP-binding protein
MRLELREIALSAGSFRLGPLTLSAGDGEYLVVLGPTGAGKTLTLETIAGLRVAGSGRIMMDGRDLTRAAPEARRCGYLFQDSLLFPHLNVRENIAYGARRNPPSRRVAAVSRFARAVGVEPLLARMPAGLSGGERQRVALARALATNPIVLLLDEPMAALDPNSRQALRATLLELHRELGTTTIHVTHSFSEALALGDRVAIMIDGRILQTGPPREVFSRPALPVIAGFLRSATLVAPGEPPDPGRGALTIVAHGLKLRANPDGDGSALPELCARGAALVHEANGDGGALAGQILAVQSGGESLRVVLNVGLKLSATVAPDSPGADWLVEGASVWVRMPETG